MSLLQKFATDCDIALTTKSAGSRGNLILTFYAPGSPFDNAVNQWRQDIALTCQATAIAKDIATGESSSLDAGSCTDTEQNFWDSLSDITELEDLRSTNGLDLPTISTSPKLGEPCTGPVNVCATSDGSRCIAEVSSENDGQYFSATCQLSHFGIDSRTQNEILVAGEDPIYKTNGSITVNTTTTYTALIPATCPCNCTYVSEACCDAPKGIVHESAKARLGSLSLKQCGGSTNES